MQQTLLRGRPLGVVSKSKTWQACWPLATCCRRTWTFGKWRRLACSWNALPGYESGKDHSASHWQGCASCFWIPGQHTVSPLQFLLEGNQRGILWERRREEDVLRGERLESPVFGMAVTDACEDLLRGPEALTHSPICAEGFSISALGGFVNSVSRLEVPTSGKLDSSFTREWVIGLRTVSASSLWTAVTVPCLRACVGLDHRDSPFYCAYVDMGKNSFGEEAESGKDNSGRIYLICVNEGQSMRKRLIYIESAEIG